MALTNGHWPDLIDLWMDYTEGTVSPPAFRLWSGIALVAGALERRVWLKYGDFTTYGNLYVVLVAPPGVGKFIIEDVRDIWESAKQVDSTLPAFRVASDSVTRASLIDELAAAKQVRISPDGTIVYHSLLVPSEEFGVLLPAFNPEFVNTLNSLYMNKSWHRETRRTSLVKEVTIENPQLHILAGTQPAYLASAFPDEVWNTGIARRLLMIYADEAPLVDLFQEGNKTPARRNALLTRISQISALWGQVRWEPEAAEALRSWHLAGGPPKPGHSRLVSYVRSRSMILAKLMLVAAVAARGELIARMADFDRALGWLLGAERSMPDIFRAMIGKSDIAVITELHQYVFACWDKDRGKAISGGMVRAFLLDRVPTEKIEGILMGALRANVLGNPPGCPDLWIPKVRPGQVE